MASSVNGIGTRFIGERDYRPDVCILYFPLIPIHSLRVIPDPKNLSIPFHTNYYTILQKRRPHLGQVLSIYACAAVTLGMAILFFAWIEPYIAEHAPSFTGGFWGTVEFAITLSPPWLFAKWLQRNARRQMRAEIRDPNNPTPIG
ncbi:MAG: hypothetical protein ABR991_08985 [Terracidiphilus sp.]